MIQTHSGTLNSLSGSNFSRTIAEHKQIFTELKKSCDKHYDRLQKISFLCGWSWWSLPRKMWRVAKALGFENDEFNYEWTFDAPGYSHWDISRAAQDEALKELREKYPDSVLLQNISSRGKLD